ncbi:MAG: LPD7 domain-containing protein [Albidovulum sp.]
MGRGDALHTRNADRSTAMDMIELAAHRGWSSMKVKGPQDFRREMWIEATAQGIKVQGYRPNDKDRAEADRRADLIGERVIERTDAGRSADGIRSESGARPSNSAKTASNVVPMIDYQKGIEGKITGIGTAPYRDRVGASSTPYVALELADGRSHKLWGVALPDMIDRHELKVGDRAAIFDDGRKAVTVKTRDPKTGEDRDVETFRREWGARDIERARSAHPSSRLRLGQRDISGQWK